MMIVEAEKLLRRVIIKKDLLSALLQIGIQQRELIESGDSVGLLRLLASKQKSIDQLVQIENQLSTLKWDFDSKSDWPSEDLRKECLHVVEECNQIGTQVFELEQDCEQKATQQRDMLANQVQELSVFDSRIARDDASSDETRLAAFDESS